MNGHSILLNKHPLWTFYFVGGATWWRNSADSSRVDIVYAVAKDMASSSSINNDVSPNTLLETLQSLTHHLKRVILSQWAPWQQEHRNW